MGSCLRCTHRCPTLTLQKSSARYRQCRVRGLHCTLVLTEPTSRSSSRDTLESSGGTRMEGTLGTKTILDTLDCPFKRVRMSHCPHLAAPANCTASRQSNTFDRICDHLNDNPTAGGEYQYRACRRNYSLPCVILSEHKRTLSQHGMITRVAGEPAKAASASKLLKALL